MEISVEAKLISISSDYRRSITELIDKESSWWIQVEDKIDEEFGAQVTESLLQADRLQDASQKTKAKVLQERIDKFSDQLQNTLRSCVLLKEYYRKQKAQKDAEIVGRFEGIIKRFATDFELEKKRFDQPKSEVGLDLSKYLNRNIWWLQANPSYWSVGEFKVGGYHEYSTHGESNNPRRIFEYFFQAKVGDLIVIYQSSPTRSLQALAKVTKEAAMRKGDDLGFEITYFFIRKTPWDVLKSLPLFGHSSIVQNNQGSLFKLSSDEFQEIIATTELGKVEVKVPAERIINGLHKVVLDNDGAFSSKDLLNFTEDIRAFATLIAMKNVKPPLAVALFGRWGTGKSFFMNRLRDTIGDLAEHQGFPPNSDIALSSLPSDEKPFCEGLVQIEFNAWSYLDSNLWAGLVSTIFEKLDDYINENVPGAREKKEVEKKLTERLQIVSEQRLSIQKEKDSLEDQQKKIEQKINDAKDEKKKLLDEVRQKSLGKIKDEALKKLKPQLDSIKSSMIEFGITDERLQELSPNALFDEVRSWVTFARNMIKFDTKEVAILIIALLAFTYLVVDPENILSDRIQELGRGALMLISLLGPLFLKGYNTFKKFKDLFGPVLAVKNNFNDLIQAAEHEHQNKVRLLEAELSAKDSKLKELSRDLSNVEQEINQVEYELKHSITKQAFFNFINKKKDDSTYESHLGIISTIRRDFETLSHLFNDANKEVNVANEKDKKRKEESEEFRGHFDKPLDRIILYIDDLDRCPDDKVMEVLQAVHLLMAFPLFIVIVGVDKRCVHNALTYRNLMQYGNFIKDGDDEALKELGINIIKPSEYLEKIFQIPFHLEEASEESIEKMIGELLDKQIKTEPVPPPTSAH